MKRDPDVGIAVDRHNAGSLLMAAVLLTHCNWLSNHSGSSQEQYHIDLETYHMCKGINTLTHKTAPWLTKYSRQQDTIVVQATDSLSHVGFMKSALDDTAPLMEAAACGFIDKTDQVSYE
jgi:hypothetical protein